MAVTWVQAVRGDRSITQASFTQEGGKVSDSYYVDRLLLLDAVKEALGSVESNGTGGLTRVLPKAHPQFWWCYVSAISSISGIGHKDIAGEKTGERVESDVVGNFEGDLLLDEYWLHPAYLLTLEFTPRMYAVLSDDTLTAEGSGTDTLTWTDETDTEKTDKISYEWMRFTDYDIIPQPEYIQAQHGQSKFRTQSGNNPDGRTYPGFPRMAVPQATVKFRWNQVPFSWVEHEDSPFVKFIGYINQKDFYLPAWTAGSLLYLGLTVRRYTPPVPEIEVWTGYQNPSQEKYCDIEMTWLYTKRTGSDVPTPLANGNWIAAGHNLFPWLVNPRGFYYTTAVGVNSSGAEDDTDDTVRYPFYLSYPFQLFFTDPDTLT